MLEREIVKEKSLAVEHHAPHSDLILNTAQMRSAAYLMALRPPIVVLDQSKVIQDAVRAEVDLRKKTQGKKAANALSIQKQPVSSRVPQPTPLSIPDPSFTTLMPQQISNRPGPSTGMSYSPMSEPSAFYDHRRDNRCRWIHRWRQKPAAWLVAFQGSIVSVTTMENFTKMTNTKAGQSREFSTWSFIRLGILNLKTHEWSDFKRKGGGVRDDFNAVCYQLWSSSLCFSRDQYNQVVEIPTSNTKKFPRLNLHLDLALDPEDLRRDNRIKETLKDIPTLQTSTGITIDGAQAYIRAVFTFLQIEKKISISADDLAKNWRKPLKCLVELIVDDEMARPETESECTKPARAESAKRKRPSESPDTQDPKRTGTKPLSLQEVMNPVQS
ncbi:hypothetical protein C8R42DRAFT_709801 [Lentinula raphanica]|nr:hypothetical protein C8R42DRAFT_709801 [Lentinula raphanica]